MRLSIRNRIYFSFLILVSLFVINGLLSIYTLNKSKKLSDYISSVIDPSQQALGDFKSLLIESKMYSTNWVFLRSSAEDKLALEQLHRVKYPRLRVKLLALTVRLNDKRITDNLKNIFKGFDHILAGQQRIMAALKAFKDYDDPVTKLGAEQIIEDEIIPHTAELMAQLEKVAAMERVIKDREYKNLETYAQRLRVLIIALAVVIFLAGIFLSLYLTRIIVFPIKQIIKMVKDLGKGKLRLINLPKKSAEIDSMVRAVNELSRKLREAAVFANETGKRNFAVEFTPLGDHDLLGKALLTMRDNLKVSENELIQSTESLVQRNKELEQFTYIISHNLRAPLANMIGLCQLLGMGPHSEQEADKMIADLVTCVERLDEVIRDINHILQAKQQVHEQMEDIVFSQILEDIKVVFKDYLEENLAELNCDFSAVDHIHSLKSYVYSIFYNLISNSIKYKRADVKLVLSIKSHCAGDNVILTFRDNGKGIDLQQNGDKLFGLYKRFDTSVEGKGLGLYMVKTQIETLGGQIDVQSKINSGTTFMITLPS
ncbi:MAG TPA: ATP-binding protein [Pedobacter sp.]|uniref:sensor histidine kinase n=1 Tax=Pedobacter sp. TaxID=1411316 RepID=UPI002CC5B2C4|nr:ATP-binding protein [Pedobacter sp.]HMI03893.1 ATP-binding protein [Pedobacter sp.]